VGEERRAEGEIRSAEGSIEGMVGEMRSRMPLMIVRESGAGCFDGEYCGRRGAAEILFVRRLTSMLGWTMVSLILKGAIS
jgi:hypothetical protein